MNNGEQKFCEFKIGFTGSFFSNLIKTEMIADTTNMELLSRGFPELTEAIRRYQNEDGYWQKLCEEWNTFHPFHKLQP